MKKEQLHLVYVALTTIGGFLLIFALAVALFGSQNFWFTKKYEEVIVNPNPTSVSHTCSKVYIPVC